MTMQISDGMFIPAAWPDRCYPRLGVTHGMVHVKFLSIKGILIIMSALRVVAPMFQDRPSFRRFRATRFRIITREFKP